MNPKDQNDLNLRKRGQAQISQISLDDRRKLAPPHFLPPRNQTICPLMAVLAAINQNGLQRRCITGEFLPFLDKQKRSERFKNPASFVRKQIRPRNAHTAAPNQSSPATGKCRSSSIPSCSSRSTSMTSPPWMLPTRNITKCRPLRPLRAT